MVDCPIYNTVVKLPYFLWKVGRSPKNLLWTRRLVGLEHILYYIYHALSCYLFFVMTYRYNILWTLAINSNLWLVHETLSKHLNPEDAKPDDAARQRVMILVSGEGNPFFFSYFVGI